MADWKSRLRCCGKTKSSQQSTSTTPNRTGWSSRPDHCGCCSSIPRRHQLPPTDSVG